jgi:hypothetical protein
MDDYQGNDWHGQPKGITDQGEGETG